MRESQRGATCPLGFLIVNERSKVTRYQLLKVIHPI